MKQIILPNRYIDLSIYEPNKNQRNLYFNDKRTKREAIAEYRERISKRMADKESCSTPWGEWTEIKEGLFLLEGDLDNRILDTELSMPMVSPTELHEGGMHDNGSVTNETSRTCRRLHREMSMAFMNDMMQPQATSDQDFTTAPLITLAIPESRASNIHKMMEAEYSGTIEKPLFDAISTKRSAYFPVLGDLIKQVEEYLKNLRSRNLNRGVLTISIRDLITQEERPLNRHKNAQAWHQTYFINLETLAMLCHDDDLIVNDSKAWVFFALQGCLTGLPCNGLTAHGDLAPDRFLSPSGHKYDPIYAILSGMWSLGFCDPYDMILSMDHVEPEKRGLYLVFKTGITTEEYFMRPEDETLADPYLDSPYYKKAVQEALAQASAVNIFDIALKETLEDTRK